MKLAVNNWFITSNLSVGYQLSIWKPTLMHNQQLWLTIYNLNTLLSTIGKESLCASIFFSPVLYQQAARRATHEIWCISMVRFHGRTYPQDGWSCVTRSRNLVIHCLCRSSPWTHIINVIIFLDHSIYSNSIGQHRRDPGLVQLGTWNRKHSGIHSRILFSGSQSETSSSPRVKLLSIHDDFTAILMKHKSIDILGFAWKRNTQIHLTSSWNMSWH